ncbi:hypothetical protein [Campylobacter curvus]|uniref:hypothetical protein n=1 Tax=Campylobacter curvus TaxID=200 RepID=UPI00037DA2EE|nr:hypothetical protein [Campylobacter curvus]QKF60530.1 hypothetical protein CCVT_0210 [Campylobacter curvus]UEB50676.1 hypothetical protein LK426_04300 [Campylobacter curvus]
MLKKILPFVVFYCLLAMNSLQAEEQAPKIQSKFVTGECRKLIKDMWLMDDPKFENSGVIDVYKDYLLSNEYLDFLIENIHSGFNAKVELYDNYEKGRTRIITYTWLSKDELIIQSFKPISKIHYKSCDIYRFKKEGNDVLMQHYTSRNLPD